MSLHLTPPLSVLLPRVHSIIVSIHLFYSPSAPKPCRPPVPPTPRALTALSLDGSSSSKAVTMMDCRLPPNLPLLPPPPTGGSFSLCPRRKSSDPLSVWHLFLAGLQVVLAPVAALKVVGGSFHRPPRRPQRKPRAVKP